MMNIAIIINSLMSGGAEKQSIYLTEQLQKDYSTWLIILDGDLIEEKFLERIKNLNVIKMKGNALRKAIDLTKFFINKNIYVSFSYLARSNLYNGFCGKIAKIPYLIGGIRNDKLPKSKIYLEKILHNYIFYQSISNSHSAVKKLSKLGFNEAKFHVIHNAYDLKQNFINREKKNIVNVISVARFVAQKDYFTSLKAVLLLKKQLNYKFIDFHYYLVGYGKLESKIRKWVNDFDLNDKVEILIKPHNLFDYYKRADIFLSTSLFEGLSNSVMEAMSFSLPIVATSAGDMEYLVRDGVNGYICEIGNIDQIQKGLYKLITDYDLRHNMSKKSYELISNNFTISSFEKEYLRFIKNVESE